MSVFHHYLKNQFLMGVVLLNFQILQEVLENNKPIFGVSDLWKIFMRNITLIGFYFIFNCLFSRIVNLVIKLMNFVFMKVI